MYTYVLSGINQNSFSKRHLKVGNLVQFTQLVSEDMGIGQVDVYTDFKKAFERLDHGYLWTKLYRLDLSVS